MNFYTANLQENVILHYKASYFCKTCAETWNFSLAKKIRLKKDQTFFAIGPVVFAPGNVRVRQN
jgi:hypothetical protein